MTSAARGSRQHGVALGVVPTPLTDFATFTAALGTFLNGSERGVVLSITGIVPPDGAAKVANIPCLDGRNLVADLRAALGLPVLVLNDADCFAIAEASQGAGRGHRTVFAAILALRQSLAPASAAVW